MASARPLLVAAEGPEFDALCVRTPVPGLFLRLSGSEKKACALDGGGLGSVLVPESRVFGGPFEKRARSFPQDGQSAVPMALYRSQRPQTIPISSSIDGREAYSKAFYGNGVL
jgi:hypothetical protein